MSGGDPTASGTTLRAGARWRRPTRRDWGGLLLCGVFLVGMLWLAVDLAVHRDDPVVRGTFVRTSDPCAWFQTRCTESGRWTGPDGIVREGVWLRGHAGDAGTVAASYRGPLPVPRAVSEVQTDGAARLEPWLVPLGVVGAIGLLAAAVNDLRLPRSGRPATGRRPGAHRPSAL